MSRIGKAPVELPGGVEVQIANGEISVKVTVEAHAFSSSASEKIAAAGGSSKTVSKK